MPRTMPCRAPIATNLGNPVVDIDGQILYNISTRSARIEELHYAVESHEENQNLIKD